MDGITTSILAASVITGAGADSRNRRARKRPENEPRKVESASSDGMP